MLVGIIIFQFILLAIKILDLSGKNKFFEIPNRRCVMYLASFFFNVFAPFVFLFIKIPLNYLSVFSLILYLVYISTQIVCLFKEGHLFKITLFNIKRDKKFLQILLLCTFIGQILFTMFQLWLSQEFKIETMSKNQLGIMNLLHSRIMPLIVIQVLILAPFFEEVIFRHIIWNFFDNLFKSVNSTLKNILICVIVSILFTSLHIINELSHFNLMTLLVMLPYLIISFVLGYLRIKYKNISISILFHILWNSSIIVVFF